MRSHLPVARCNIPNRQSSTTCLNASCHQVNGGSVWERTSTRMRFWQCPEIRNEDANGSCELNKVSVLCVIAFKVVVDRSALYDFQIQMSLNLDGIGARRNRKELLASILEPSRLIEPAYQTYVVLTDTGEIVTGLKVAETDSEWTLRSADGKDIRIPIDSIESSRLQTQSLMPTGLAAEMTADELADLLAYLESLKSK